MENEQISPAEGPIVLGKNPEEIRAELYNMPAGFEWSDVDISNANQRK
jgi:hypothetical protein